MKALLKSAMVYANGEIKKQDMLLDGATLSIFSGDLSSAAVRSCRIGAVCAHSSITPLCLPSHTEAVLGASFGQTVSARLAHALPSC